MDSLSIPGLVVAHTHLYSALARGMPPPPTKPESFPQILEKIWWRLDRALDHETIQMSARVGIADAVRAGATCLFDHHESPNAIEGSLDVIADEMQRAGVRGVVCYGITARNRGDEEWQAGLAENERFLKTNQRPHVRGMVGIHACFTVPDEAIGEAAAMARAFGVGMHIHVAEDTIDRDAFARLHRKRALLPNSVYAHAVHLQPDEVRRLAESGGWLVQNARSNMGNAVGYARLGQAADRVALGTDGWDGDMLSEARALHMRASEAGDPVDVMTRIRAGRRLAESVFGGPIPDRVELEYDPPTPLADENETAHLLFGSPRVVNVVVDGVALAPDYEPSEARKQAVRLWLRMAEL
jgi:cytosine/adenosine deaminase-related metal-dependent hydrolase